ncbi:TraB/GumN family protein [Sphingobium algorifonticola]|uniref:TraB/GumN family protein n=1 Tax=Sphingobium algorifonticola TaxID=2008318 RepID=A0A437J802_9SPHN|nr:TraB/GumN family protein [Sphingobium algorifonticola]RVT41147.1 TraB/GumN family protein [Sphingobium algorifonticola]
MRNPLIAFIGTALLLLSACTDGKPEAQSGGPALWRIEKDGQRAFLFGTIHVLPDDVAWETPVLRDAMAASDRLVLEASGLDDAEGTQRIFDQLGQSDDLPPIADRVPAAQRPALRALLKRGDMDEADASAYESWAAALQLATVTQSGQRMSAANGVEPALTAVFLAEDKPVLGLETVTDQFVLFDRLPEDVQRRLLADAVAQADAGDADYARMVRAWLKGDMQAIARDFVNQIAPEPALAGPLLIDRNRKWAARIPLLPGRPFIAVGAAHLAGPGNLLALLENDGYSITRIQ